MKFKKAISEDWVAGFKNRGREYVEIFKNPSINEYDEVSGDLNGENYIRFIADGNKKILFIFSPSVLHSTALRKLGYDPYYDYDKTKDIILQGVAKKSSSWICDVSNTFTYQIDEDEIEAIIETDWSWLKKYNLNIDSLLHKFKSKESSLNFELESDNFMNRKK